MKVFEIMPLEGFEWVLPVEERDIEKLRFDGQPLRASWTPVKMQRVELDNRRRPRQESDFPFCSGGEMLMLRQHAFDTLGAVLAAYGELLPLDYVEPLWALNVTRLVDALDQKRSELLVSQTGKILRVKVPVFDPELLSGVHIFKLVSMPRGLIYVTAAFADLVRSSGLTGLGFKQVWSPS